jgi:hypothetical protein
MSATVTGAYNGQVYQVDLGPADDVIGEDFDSSIEFLLRVNEGEFLALSPAGPVTRLDLNDPQSVLIALNVLTRITHLTGEAQALLPPFESEPGLIH